jgi:excisionase family DNA binding protein
MLEKKYYTKNEVAEILGLSAKTVERYLLAGKLKAARLGKVWKVSEDDIHAFYEAVKVETAKLLRLRNKEVDNTAYTVAEEIIIEDKAYDQHSFISIKAQELGDYLRVQKADYDYDCISDKVYYYVLEQLANVKWLANAAHQICCGNGERYKPGEMDAPDIWVHNFMVPLMVKNNNSQQVESHESVHGYGKRAMRKPKRKYKVV